MAMFTKEPVSRSVIMSRKSPFLFLLFTLKHFIPIHLSLTLMAARTFSHSVCTLLLCFQESVPACTRIAFCYAYVQLPFFFLVNILLGNANSSIFVVFFKFLLHLLSDTLNRLVLSFPHFCIFNYLPAQYIIPH